MKWASKICQAVRDAVEAYLFVGSLPRLPRAVFWTIVAANVQGWVGLLAPSGTGVAKEVAMTLGGVAALAFVGFACWFWTRWTINEARQMCARVPVEEWDNPVFRGMAWRVVLERVFNDLPLPVVLAFMTIIIGWIRFDNEGLSTVASAVLGLFVCAYVVGRFGLPGVLIGVVWLLNKRTAHLKARVARAKGVDVQGLIDRAKALGIDGDDPGLLAEVLREHRATIEGARKQAKAIDASTAKVDESPSPSRRRL